MSIPRAGRRAVCSHLLRLAWSATALMVISIAGAWPAGLPAETGWCAGLVDARLVASAEEKTYRCDLIDQWRQRGLHFPGPTANAILVELARPYRSLLQIEGEIALPRPVADYLFRHLPDTARLTNHYNGTNYQAHYTNAHRSRFYGTNNRNMEAYFDIVEARVDERTSRYLLFEQGSARLLFWRFRGNTVVELDLVPVPSATKYQLRVHIFTDSWSYKSFFDSALFRYLVGSMCRQIISAVANAALSMHSSPADIQFSDPAFSAGLLHRLQTPKREDTL